MKEIIPRTPVIIIGADGSNPLGIARALGRHRIPVYLVADNNAALTRCSRYVRGGEYNVNIIDPPALKTALQKVLQRCRTKPMLIVTNETHYHCLMPVKEWIQENFIEFMPMKQAVLFAEKEQQFPLAQQAGFTLPATVLLKTPADLEQLNALRFPLIIKPSALHLQGGFHHKALIFETFNELKTEIEHYLSHPSIELLAQEFVPGDDKQVLFFMASCGEGGEPRAWVTGRKVRQYPPGRGVMTAGILEALPNLEEKSKTLCRLFGIRGFIGIECKEHPETGEYVYIESSIRTDAFHSICSAVDMNLVWDAYSAALGFPCGVQRQTMKGSWCSVSIDLDAARILIAAGKMTWREYLTPLPRPIVFAFFTWDDPLPFLRWLPVRIQSLCRKIFCRR